MSFDQIYLVVMLATAGIGGLVILMQAIGSTIYDLQTAKMAHFIRTHPRAKGLRRRPLVSVIVLTKNDERTIETCLKALAKSTYRQIEIVVCDQASSDQTVKLAKAFIKKQRRSKLKVRLYARRRAGALQTTLAQCQKQYAKGKLVMLLSPSVTLDKQAVTNAVKHFNSQDDIDVLAPNYQVGASLTTARLFQRYDNCLYNRVRKFSSVSKTAYWLERGALIYTAQQLRKLLKVPKARSAELRLNTPLLSGGVKSPKLFYANDVVAYEQPCYTLFGFYRRQFLARYQRLMALWRCRQLFFSYDPHYSKFLTWLRLPLAAASGLALIMTPLLLAYFVYLALSLHQPVFFELSLAVLSILLLSAIWGDQQFSWPQKIAYTLGMPLTFGLFFISFCLQLPVLLAALLHGLRYLLSSVRQGLARLPQPSLRPRTN